MEWTTKTAIYSFIKDGARRAAQGSLLIVCIMSHGSAGTLRSEDGDGCVLINDLIARLTGRLPEDLPLVSPRLPMSNNVLTSDQAKANITNNHQKVLVPYRISVEFRHRLIIDVVVEFTCPIAKHLVLAGQ